VNPSRVLTRAATLAVTVLLASSGLAGAQPSREDSGPQGSGPREALQDAATGSWSGDLGTIAFATDGTATFAVRACGFKRLRPGFAKVFTDCEPDTLRGKVRVEEDRYALVEADGTEIDYDSYVGADGLHAGFGVVAQLDRHRHGTVDIVPNEQLEIGDGHCRYTAPNLKHPISAPCSFVRRSGRTVLLYKAPDPLHEGKVAVTGLVYLARSRLVVSAELVERPFKRTKG
jgi:hypothetical protein